MERFQYYAFISYSRKDEKWAEWLHKKLESYKLPSIIRKESNGNLPKQIRPVFRDKTDIGTGSLEQNIKAELEDSRFLIVICSPSAAASEWVNKEIHHFKSLGRGERIIPFIVEGTPDPKNDFQKQCYPPELSTTTLGVSINELSKEASYIKVIAAILGLKFDQLWQRHKRGEKRKFLIRTSIISFVSALLLSLILWYWDYNRVKTNYYADYIEHWGIPEGIGKLTKNEIQHRYVSYLFEYQRRKLKKVKIVSSTNMLRVEGHAEKAKRDPETRYEYRDDGKLLLKKCYNLVGLETVRFSYSEDLRTINIVSADERVPQTLNSGLTSTVNYNNQSNIIRFLNEYDNKGRLTKQTFAKDWNIPVPDGNGIYGMEYEYYANDQVKSIAYLDQSGNRTVKSNLLQNSWESKKEFSYNENGWLEKISYYDLEDQLTNNSWNYSVEEDIHDKWGNIIEIRNLDRRNQLTLNQFNYASEKIKYDAEGNIIEHSFHDKDGNLTECSYGYAKFTNEFEFSPNLATTTKYFDKNDQPKMNKQGFAITKTLYLFRDSTVNVTYEYYNQKQQPCMLSDNKYFSVSSTYDKNGNLWMTEYRDTLGKFCNCNLGYALYFADYQDNLKILETYLPPDSSRLIVENLGYTKVLHKYDKWRNLIENSYFDRKMKPVNNSKGYHKECWAFDEKGNIKSIIYYDTVGRLANNKDYQGAIYEATYEYNDYGEPKITNNWYDKNRNPVTKNLAFKTSPLHWACTSGQPNKVIQLFSEGADKFAIDETGITPAQAAAYNNKMECLTLIYPEFDYKNQIKRIKNKEDIDILNCQLILSGKENDILQYFNNAVRLENQIILFTKKYPGLVKSYYRCVALIADQLADCQLAYSMLKKNLNISYSDSDDINNDREMINTCSWYALKTGRFKEALDLLKPFEQEILTESKAESITLNYAHALLLNNRIEDAEKIYFSNSGKLFLKTANINWNNVMKGDFEALTWFGHGKKEMNEILNKMGMEKIDISTKMSDKPLQNNLILGKWKCIENGLIIEWEISPDGLSFYKFYDNKSNLLQKMVGVWRAVEKDSILKFEENISQIGQFAQGDIRIIDNNNFELTILDNGNNLYQYKQRKYSRIR